MHKEQHAFFFVNSVAAGRAILTKDEYRHACLALRMAGDSALYATDGGGNIYKCKLGARVPEGCEVEISETRREPAPHPCVRVYVGLPEKEAFEEALTGLTALGAEKIAPVVCGFCQGRWWDPWEERSERLQRKMIAAVKQAHNPWLPELLAPLPFTEALRRSCVGAEGRVVRLAADPGGETMAAAVNRPGLVERVDCFIGPPGGFSPEELQQFSANGIRFVRVARHRLRTELAAIVTCSSIMQQYMGTGSATAGQKAMPPENDC
jgi:16S rRNA (uracil1498-N3)-methyltransferase